MHANERIGLLVAYARMNGIVPPSGAVPDKHSGIGNLPI